MNLLPFSDDHPRKDRRQAGVSQASFLDLEITLRQQYQSELDGELLQDFRHTGCQRSDLCEHQLSGASDGLQSVRPDGTPAHFEESFLARRGKAPQREPESRDVLDVDGALECLPSLAVDSGGFDD